MEQVASVHHEYGRLTLATAGLLSTVSHVGFLYAVGWRMGKKQLRPS